MTMPCFKWYPSIVGSVVECSPATRAARVRFPDDAISFWVHSKFYWLGAHIKLAGITRSGSGYSATMIAVILRSRYVRTTFWNPGPVAGDLYYNLYISVQLNGIEIWKYRSLWPVLKGINDLFCPSGHDYTRSWSRCRPQIHFSTQILLCPI